MMATRSGSRTNAAENRRIGCFPPYCEPPRFPRKGGSPDPQDGAELHVIASTRKRPGPEA